MTSTTTQTITCVGRTRDGRPCSARATEVINAPTGQRLDVCGTHRIAYEETGFSHGGRAAVHRVLTGKRP